MCNYWHKKCKDKVIDQVEEKKTIFRTQLSYKQLETFNPLIFFLDIFSIVAMNKKIEFDVMHPNFL